MNGMNLFLGILLGLGLSASTGLNTFLPLLLLSAAARFNIAGIELGLELNTHADVQTTMIYTHVLNSAGGRGVRSPLETLERRA